MIAVIISHKGNWKPSIRQFCENPTY